MSDVHTSFRNDAHGYTRSEAPWILEEYKSSYGKLIHYLSGGGMQTFGRTIDQEVARLKHERFLVKAAIIGVLWLVFYFV